jgi:uncharacterized membrane protein
VNRMLVVVFANESDAYAGARALEQLHADGRISLYSSAVVAKDAKGKVSIKEAVARGPIGTGIGMAVGALIGVLGGPAGMALGAAAGTLVGALRDYWVAGVDIDFVEEVEESLQPGKLAVVAELDEDWVIAVDNAMEAAGGVVFRRARADVADAQIDKELAAIKAEIAELKAEYHNASGHAKTSLQAKVAAADARLEKALQRANHRLEQLEHEAQAKIGALEQQLAKTQGELREKLEDRLTRVRTAYASRGAKLKQAWGLTRQALASV